METSSEAIAGLIQKVLEELATADGPQGDPVDGLFSTVNDAVEAGLAAQKKTYRDVVGAAQRHHRFDSPERP